MMDRIEEAKMFAERALLGVTDKGGAPMVAHAHRMVAIAATKGYSDSVLVVAHLHDVVEDSTAQLYSNRIELGIKVIHSVGLSPNEVEALDLLSRREGEKYVEYISRLIAGRNAIALCVKQLDAQDHLEPVDTLPDSLKGRYEKVLDRIENARINLIARLL